ncbi:hypothetical protein POVCU2_0095030 [Plasmodium ovale curtisi]|uniref:Uncharacterized protein n=1 Tax=Plasmodium ovale curtisi TaxID=864141 RepID=A0A1A8X690_PLAOA|nr:hypothetical protein POVCU2_0095030 [Plasmodium ovale curtisi]SBT00761.1 hypothetical protein POVCU1_062170 [Plasmodium ovale curtisi]
MSGREGAIWDDTADPKTLANSKVKPENILTLRTTTGLHFMRRSVPRYSRNPPLLAYPKRYPYDDKGEADKILQKGNKDKKSFSNNTNNFRNGSILKREGKNKSQSNNRNQNNNRNQSRNRDQSSNRDRSNNRDQSNNRKQSNNRNWKNDRNKRIYEHMNNGSNDFVLNRNDNGIFGNYNHTNRYRNFEQNLYNNDNMDKQEIFNNKNTNISRPLYTHARNKNTFKKYARSTSFTSNQVEKIAHQQEKTSDE